MAETRICDWCREQFNTADLWFRVDGRYQCDSCSDKAKESLTPMKTVKCALCGMEKLDSEIASKAFGDICKTCTAEAAMVMESGNDKVTFTSGAQSSGVMPAYHLCPFDDFLPRLAARYQLGRDKGYALDNWRKGLEDDAYVADRLNHGLQHMLNAITKITRGDYTNGEDDDLAGAMWAIAFGMAAQKARGQK